MSDDNIVEVRITGAVDSSLASAVSQANATLGTISDQTTAAAAAISATLKAVGDDIGKLTSQLSALGSAAATTGAGVSSGLSTAEQSARTLGSTATTSGTQVASGLKTAEEATSRLHFATAGAIQDYFRLGQAAASGDFAGMAGTLGSLASETGLFDAALAVLGTEAAIATGGLALLVGFVGTVAYQEYQAQQESQKLADGFALTGRAAGESAQGVRSQIAFLSSASGVSKEAAESFLQYVAAHASIDPVLANETGQLLPRFIELFGKDGPEAAGKLTETLSNLTEEGFKKLDREMLGLPPAEYELVQGLIRTGHEAEAVNRILKDLSQATGDYIKTAGDRVYDDLQKIAALHRVLETGQHAIIDGRIINVGDVQAKLREVQKDLDDVRAGEVKANQKSADNKFNDTYDEEKNRNLSEHDRLLQQLAKDQQQLNDAEKRGNVPNAVKAARASIQGDNQKIADLDKRQNEESLRNFVASEDAKVAATKSGSAARIATIQGEIAQAKSLHLDGTTAFSDLQKKLGEEQRAAGEAGARAGAKAVEDARHNAEELAQIHQAAELKHIESENKTNESLLALGKETLDQFKAQAIKLENDRYKAELDGIHARENADKGNVAALAKDQEEERGLLQEHKDREIAIDQDYQRKKQQSDQDALQQFIKDRESELSIAITGLQEQERTHQTTKAKEIADEIDLTKAVRAQVLQQLDAKITALKAENKDFEYYTKLREQFLRQSNQRLAQLDANLVEDEKEKWINLSQTIFSSVGGALKGMAFQGETAGQALKSVASDIGGAFIDMGVKWLEGWVETLIFGQAQSTTTGIAEIGTAAAVAAANAIASTAAIPLIGPELAPAAGAAAYSEAIAYEGAVAFDKGTNELPSDMLAIVHAGERIVPAADNRELTALVRQAANSNVGPLLPVMSPSASVRIAALAPMSDADYVASRIGGSGRTSASASQAPSRTRGGDIHIHAWDASSMNQFFRKPSNRRTMDQISKDRVRAGFLPG